jgi:hypothetical protein
VPRQATADPPGDSDLFGVAVSLFGEPMVLDERSTQHRQRGRATQPGQVSGVKNPSVTSVDPPNETSTGWIDIGEQRSAR